MRTWVYTPRFQLIFIYLNCMSWEPSNKTNSFVSFWTMKHKEILPSQSWRHLFLGGQRTVPKSSTLQTFDRNASTVSRKWIKYISQICFNWLIVLLLWPWAYQAMTLSLNYIFLSFSLKKVFIFYFMYMSDCASCPQRPEQGIRSSGIWGW